MEKNKRSAEIIIPEYIRLKFILPSRKIIK